MNNLAAEYDAWKALDKTAEKREAYDAAKEHFITEQTGDLKVTGRCTKLNKSMIDVFHSMLDFEKFSDEQKLVLIRRIHNIYQSEPLLKDAFDKHITSTVGG